MEMMMSNKAWDKISYAQSEAVQLEQERKAAIEWWVRAVKNAYGCNIDREVAVKWWNSIPRSNDTMEDDIAGDGD
jgi:hypothetical protein